jgi:hypothetical protein
MHYSASGYWLCPWEPHFFAPWGGSLLLTSLSPHLSKLELKSRNAPSLARAGFPNLKPELIDSSSLIAHFSVMPALPTFPSSCCIYFPFDLALCWLASHSFRDSYALHLRSSTDWLAPWISSPALSLDLRNFQLTNLSFDTAKWWALCSRLISATPLLESFGFCKFALSFKPLGCASNHSEDFYDFTWPFPSLSK